MAWFNLKREIVSKELEAHLRDAKDGDPESQRIVGMAYLTGSGVRPDVQVSEVWLTKAAEAGDSIAKWGLIELYGGFSSGGPSRDSNKAVAWLTRVANEGDSSAQYMLAKILMQAKSLDQSLHWCKLAAAQDQPEAWHLLATYFEQTGKREEYKAAMRESCALR